MVGTKYPSPPEFADCLSRCWRLINYSNPMWCSQTGRDFEAEVAVHGVENVSSDFCTASPERYRQCSIPFSGRAHTATLLDVGLAYNLSNTRLALMYPPGQGHKCGRPPPCESNSNGSLCNLTALAALEEQHCEQNTTIRDIYFGGNVSSGAIFWDGALGSTCEGISNCSGSGLAGVCHVNYTAICYSRNNCPQASGSLGALGQATRGTVQEVCALHVVCCLLQRIPCGAKAIHSYFCNFFEFSQIYSLKRPENAHYGKSVSPWRVRAD